MEYEALLCIPTLKFFPVAIQCYNPVCGQVVYVQLCIAESSGENIVSMVDNELPLGLVVNAYILPQHVISYSNGVSVATDNAAVLPARVRNYIVVVIISQGVSHSLRRNPSLHALHNFLSFAM